MSAIARSSRRAVAVASRSFVRHLSSRAGATEPPKEVVKSPFATSFHYTPTSPTDLLPMQGTRVQRLTDEMLEAKQIGVRTMSQMGFRLLDGTFLFGPIALFPKVALSWRVSSPAEMTADSVELFCRLEPKLDIVVIGVGDRKHIDEVRKRIFPPLRAAGIGLEISCTEDALTLFNFLNSENRYVAAGLYPPDDHEVSNEEYADVINQLRSPEEADWPNPIWDSSLFDSKEGDERTQELITKILGPGITLEEIQHKYLEPIRERRKALAQETFGKSTERLSDGQDKNDPPKQIS